MTGRLAPLLAALLVAAVVGGGCGGSDTTPTVAAPSGSVIPSATPMPSDASSVAPSPSPSETPAVTPSPSGGTPMPSPVFTLSSTAVADGGAIPRRYTCDGPDVSPPLAWAGAPADASAFALIVDDPDAHGFVHWVVVDLPGGPEGSLAEGASGDLSTPTVEGRNDFGRRGYAGPCPPSGTHHYRFTLYALTAPLGLPAGTTAAAVRKAAEGRTLTTVTLDATYRRG